MANKKEPLSWGFGLVLATLIVSVPIIVFVGKFFIDEAPITKGNLEIGVEYKPGLDLDIYYPTQNKFDQAPVVLFVHGGAWIGGRKESINVNRFNGAVKTLRNEGYYVLSPTYTLATADSGPFPYCINDVYDVLDWIKENASHYSFDLNNVGIFGESAGGHIAMMLAYASSDSLPFRLNYVVDVYGPSELNGIYHNATVDSVNALIQHLPKRYRQSFDITRMLFGFDPEEDTVRTNNYLNNYSPINYVTSSAPATLIIQGNEDIIVPMSQSIILQKRLDSLEVENEFHLLDQVHHGFFGATDQQKEMVQTWISAFVLRHRQ